MACTQARAVMTPAMQPACRLPVNSAPTPRGSQGLQAAHPCCPAFCAGNQQCRREWLRGWQSQTAAAAKGCVPPAAQAAAAPMGRCRRWKQVPAAVDASALQQSIVGGSKMLEWNACLHARSWRIESKPSRRWQERQRSPGGSAGSSSGGGPPAAASSGGGPPGPVCSNGGGPAAASAGDCEAVSLMAADERLPMGSMARARRQLIDPAMRRRCRSSGAAGSHGPAPGCLLEPVAHPDRNVAGSGLAMQGRPNGQCLLRCQAAKNA